MLLEGGAPIRPVSELQTAMGRSRLQSPSTTRHPASPARQEVIPEPWPRPISHLPPPGLPPLCLPSTHPRLPHWPETVLWPLHPSSKSTAAPWCPQMKSRHLGPMDRAPRTPTVLPSMHPTLPQVWWPDSSCCQHLQAFALLFPQVTMSSSHCLSLVYRTNSRIFRAPPKSLCHRAPALVPGGSGNTGEKTEGLGLAVSQLPFSPAPSIPPPQVGELLAMPLRCLPHHFAPCCRNLPTPCCPCPILDCGLKDLCPPTCRPHLSQTCC